MNRQGTAQKSFLFYFITLFIGFIIWIATNTNFSSSSTNVETIPADGIFFMLLMCGVAVLFCSPLLIPIATYFYFLHGWKKANSLSLRCTLNALFGVAISCTWAFMIDNRLKGIYELWPFIMGACLAGIIVEIASIDTRTLEANPKSINA